MLALILLSEGGGEGPDISLSWLLYIGFVFFLLIVIIGWLVSRRKQSTSEVQHNAKKSIKKDADDLVKIEGIGPKVAKVLKDAGVTTYEELAKELLKSDDVK